MSMRTKKLILKLLDNNTGKMKWFHVCYIGERLYKTFLTKMDIEPYEYADYIADWFKQDFGVDITMTTKRDLCILKGTVKERYRALYPTIYNNTDIDTQGWVRVWLSKKMEEELKNV